MKRPTTRREPPKGPSQRQLRAGELMRHALVEILREEAINDPVLTGISVTLECAAGSTTQTAPWLTPRSRTYSRWVAGSTLSAAGCSPTSATCVLDPVFGSTLDTVCCTTSLTYSVWLAGSIAIADSPRGSS